MNYAPKNFLTSAGSKILAVAACCLLLISAYLPVGGHSSALIQEANGCAETCNNKVTTDNGEFSIEFKGSSENGSQVTYTYEVCKLGVGPVVKDLSHWNLALDACTAGAFVSCSTPVGNCFLQSPNPDPTTGIVGVKFDNSKVGDGQCVTFSFTLDESLLDEGKELATGCVEAATKAGDQAVGTSNPPGFACVPGPVCTDSVTPQSNISGTKFYDRNLNGARDPEDSPVEGVKIKVTILDENGDPTGEVLEDTTDAEGNWSVGPLDEGTKYRACEELPGATWLQTGPNDGATAGGATASGGCWEGTVGEEDTTGLDFGNIRQFNIRGMKFYDANVDGLKGGAEVGIEGFRIAIQGTKPNGDLINDVVTTDSDGNWSAGPYPDGTTYIACEILPGTGTASQWVQTGPVAGTMSSDGNAAANSSSCWAGTVGDEGDTTELDFGNVCVTPLRGGFTLGFWSNKNGQATITGSDLCTLNGLCLRNGTGANFDPVAGCPTPTSAQISAGKTALKNWLLNGNAVNMAYMLSVQLTATTLSTLHGLDENTVIFLTGNLATCFGSNTTTIANVMSLANASLCANPNTTGAGAARSAQECLKNILDAINNNALSSVSPSPCNVVYAE